MSILVAFYGVNLKLIFYGLDDCQPVCMCKRKSDILFKFALKYTLFFSGVCFFILRAKMSMNHASPAGLKTLKAVAYRMS